MTPNANDSPLPLATRVEIRTQSFVVAFLVVTMAGTFWQLLEVRERLGGLANEATHTAASLRDLTELTRDHTTQLRDLDRRMTSLENRMTSLETRMDGIEAQLRALTESINRIAPPRLEK